MGQSGWPPRDCSLRFLIALFTLPTVSRCSWIKSSDVTPPPAPCPPPPPGFPSLLPPPFPAFKNLCQLLMHCGWHEECFTLHLVLLSILEAPQFTSYTPSLPCLYPRLSLVTCDHQNGPLAEEHPPLRLGPLSTRVECSFPYVDCSPPQDSSIFISSKTLHTVWCGKQHWLPPVCRRETEARTPW